jgi:hypothetical protein
MKSIPFLSLAALLFGGSVVAQTPAPAFYAESFRKTPIRVAEDKFEVKLTADNSTYKQRIRDSSGGERFELTMTPRRPQGGANNQITSWEMSLVDLRYPVYGNLLQFDRELSEDPKDNLYWLNPASSAAVPIRSKRMIKIHGFYFTAQVTEFRVASPTPYLEFMTVQLQLTTSDPRQQPQ